MGRLTCFFDSARRLIDGAPRGSTYGPGPVLTVWTFACLGSPSENACERAFPSLSVFCVFDNNIRIFNRRDKCFR